MGIDIIIYCGFLLYLEYFWKDSKLILVLYADIRAQSPFLEANEQLGTENITVILRWTEDRGALYESVILPRAFKIISTTSIVLTLQYNVLYNVSVAVSLCGHISTDKLKLNYGEAIYFINAMIYMTINVSNLFRLWH